MSQFNTPMGTKPSVYWDETAGLQQAQPMIIKIVNSAQQRQTMPGKCPAIFGLTVGYTVPFQWTSHYTLWQVIPADIELRENHLIFVPATKEDGIKPVKPVQSPEAESDRLKSTAKKPKPKPQQEEREPVDKSKPSYVLKYLRVPLNGKNPPAVPVGVTFLTEHNNHRVNWHIMPTSEELATGLLILDPWDNEDESEDHALPPARWWQRG